MCPHFGQGLTKETSGNCILRNLLQRIGLYHCGGRLSKIYMAGHEEWQAGTLGYEVKLGSTGRLPSSGKPLN